MLARSEVRARQIYIRLFLWLCVFFLYPSYTSSLYGVNVDTSIGINSMVRENGCGRKRLEQPLVYYLYVADFAQSFIRIPTSNVSEESSTTSSTYLAGRATIYNENNQKFGTCSASFLCMQNEEGIYTDISNYLSADNGLIVTWFTPTRLINLELDSIVHSMVTECIVLASTKVGFNPFYGKEFNLVVSSDDEKIYFKFYRRLTFF